MSPQENYRDFREINREANEKFSSANFCSGAECCESNLLILNHDMDVIKKAAKQGKIEPKTIERAKERAKDPNLESCPFLSDENRCTIYPYRPLVCMQYGMGGTPVDPKMDEEVMDGNYEPSETLPVRKVKLFSCDNCADKVSDEIQVPLFVCQLSAGTRQIIGEEMDRTKDYMSMNGFISRDL